MDHHTTRDRIAAAVTLAETDPATAVAQLAALADELGREVEALEDDVCRLRDELHDATRAHLNTALVLIRLREPARITSGDW